jgi:hypothetical protein
MEAWSVGVLEYWTGRSDGPVGALERWSVGALERWSVGALERWSVGALERWTVGAVEYRPEEVNGPKGLGRIAQEPVGL